jgi:cell division protein FtsB
MTPWISLMCRYHFHQAGIAELVRERESQIGKYHMGTPPTEELLRKKIQELKASQADLRQEMSKLKPLNKFGSSNQTAHVR